MVTHRIHGRIEHKSRGGQPAQDGVTVQFTQAMHFDPDFAV
jgi:hypothetical protein